MELLEDTFISKLWSLVGAPYHICRSEYLNKSAWEVSVEEEERNIHQKHTDLSHNLDNFYTTWVEWCELVLHLFENVTLG